MLLVYEVHVCESVWYTMYVPLLLTLFLCEFVYCCCFCLCVVGMISMFVSMCGTLHSVCPSFVTFLFFVSLFADQM